MVLRPLHCIWSSVVQGMLVTEAYCCTRPSTQMQTVPDTFTDMYLRLCSKCISVCKQRHAHATPRVVAAASETSKRLNHCARTELVLSITKVQCQSSVVIHSKTPQLCIQRQRSKPPTYAQLDYQAPCLWSNTKAALLGVLTSRVCL